MPKTKFQSIIFTVMMVFCMVYCMTVYTIALNFGSLNYRIFTLAIKEMWLEYAVVFLLIFFVITKNSKKLAFKVINPNNTQPVFVTLSIQCFTVCQIVPVITLFATLVHNGVTVNWFSQWIELVVKCFPMALFSQVFFIGPVVRFLFGIIFKKQLNEES